MSRAFDLGPALRADAVGELVGLDGAGIVPADTAGRDRAVAPGTNLLVTGPPMTGKGRIALELLAAGFRADDAAVVVTTTEAATGVVERLTERTAPTGIASGASTA